MKKGIEAKTDMFFKAGEFDLSAALEILKLYKEDFRREKSYLRYDNYVKNSLYDEFFEEERRLSRFYNTIKCENNLETFTVMLLDSALTYENKDFNLDVLSQILEFREDFGIKDGTVVQLLVEKVYEVDKVYKENLIEILYTLVENNVSFRSDTQGYLAQIVTACDEIENKNEMLYIS